MKATELRIDNYLIINGFENVIQGGGIGAVQSGYLAASPIPLTEQWLKDFGFEESSKGHYLHSWAKGDVLLPAKDNIIFNEIGLDIIYVHQLQNLYFALTGKELTK